MKTSAISKLMIPVFAAQESQDYDEMLYQAQQLAQKYPSEDAVTRSLLLAQELYVESKLSSKAFKDLEAKGDFETMYTVCMHLRNMAPSSRLLKEKIEKIEPKLIVYREKQQRKDLKSALAFVRELMLKGELDRALLASYEALQKYPAQRALLHLHEKLEVMRESKIDQDLYPVLSEKYLGLKEAYAKNPDAYIKA